MDVKAVATPTVSIHFRKTFVDLVHKALAVDSNSRIKVKHPSLTLQQTKARIARAANLILLTND